MKLIFVRHGQSEANVDNEIYFQKLNQDIELTEKGKKQAKLSAKFIDGYLDEDSNVEIVYSPFTRTKQTADIIKKNIIKCDGFDEDVLLRELNWGSYWQNKNHQNFEQELKNMKEDKYYYQFPFGESMAQAYDRVVIWHNNLKYHLIISQLNKSLNNNHYCIIVTHGMMFKLFKQLAFGLTTKETMNMNHPRNGELFIFDVFAGNEIASFIPEVK